MMIMIMTMMMTMKMANMLDTTSICHIEYSSFMCDTDERGFDLDCTDVFLKTARISVQPDPLHKVHIKSEFMQSRSRCLTCVENLHCCSR